MSHREVLEAELQNFAIDLPPEQKLSLARYCDELAHWNKRINLTGLDGREMVRRLVVEPVWIALQLRLSGILVDIGSGNGSPAIPFHVTGHLERIHLVEARARRAAFLRHTVLQLQLDKVTVHRARFEETTAELAAVDWVTLQGVALSDELLDSIRLIARPTTTVVWITSQAMQASLTPVRILEVPITGTKVLLFRLDLS